MILEEFLASQNKIVVLDKSPDDVYCHLDLSVTNPQLSKEICSNSETLGAYIDDYINQRNATLAFGGYNEQRAIYQRSNIFNDNLSEERDLHIGIDLWAKADTKVFAAFNGKVHSMANNLGKGNYGPTIILQHTIENQNFYTLYGHLNLTCLQKLSVGQNIVQGQEIGSLGIEIINGDYPPHLHFQLIKNIADYSGDYPGVCQKSEANYFLANCPNPNLLLKLN